MATQTTLLTCHKGVDLHAATAWRVMRDRLRGGERLVALRRAEYYTYWEDDPDGRRLAELLDTGRCFNPNKHHYGHFALADAGAAWSGNEADCRGGNLPAGWPGEARGSDLPAGGDLYARLLGGAPAAPLAAVDVCAFPLGESGPVLGGVLWRLVLETGREGAGELADRLVVARGSREGLLVNPHMQGWLLAVRGAGAADAAG